MVKFLELEEYSPGSTIKTKVFINKLHISLLKQAGIYTSITLYCGKEIKVSESVHYVLKKCTQKTIK